MSIVIRNMARVKVPEEKLAQVLRMYLYEGRDGSKLKNYKYTPSNGYAYLPLNYAKLEEVAQLLGEDIIDERSEGLAISQPFVVKDSFKFRDYQVEPAFKLLEHIRANNYGVLSAGCGTGKTSVMTWVAGQLGLRTIILVDMSALAASWIYTFEMIYGITPQIITKDTTDFEDVAIVTFQLLHLNPDLKDRLRNIYGTCLIDEFHGVQAETYKEGLWSQNNKYRIGCTATYRKKGYSDEVLSDLVAPISVTMKDPSALICDVYFVESGVRFISNNPDDWGRITSKLAKDETRNKFISALTTKAVLQGRKVLVIGLTTESLKFIERLLKPIESCKTQVYVGTTTLEQDQQLKDDVASGKINVVLSAKKFDRGTDCPDLDFIILAAPSNNQSTVEQRIGRIVRRVEGKPTPIICDVVDNSDLAKGFAKNRRKWYRNLNHRIVEDLS